MKEASNTAQEKLSVMCDDRRGRAVRNYPSDGDCIKMPLGMESSYQIQHTLLNTQLSVKCSSSPVKGMDRGAFSSAKRAIFAYDGCRTLHSTQNIIFKMGFQSEVELLDVSSYGILCVVSMIHNIRGRD